MKPQEAMKILNQLDFFLGGNPNILEKAEEALTIAKSALQAQIPRVLTFDEIKSDLPHHLWIDCVEPVTLYPAIARECVTIDGNDWMMFSEDGFGGDYGVRKLYCETWRCWTHKPTAEQMAAEPWSKA